jgi:pimeloyl-ACP methyl ester carboxylesterase
MNTLQAKNTSLSVRVVGLLALVFIIGTRAATAQEPAKVLLLLHGMNSSPDTWNDFVALKFNNSCATIADGVLTDNSTPNPQGVLCYRIRFGSFDLSSGRVGLEGITPTSSSSGDFSSFTDLGREVRRAVRGILDRYGNAETVVVAHSRGGLAARAFLQRQAGFQAKASVVGLLTTGAPHRGSQLGRIYKYLKAHPRGTCCQADWDVVDFLRGTRSCGVGPIGIENPTPLDVRRPTIRDLADDSPAIDELNRDIILLPAAIQYGQIVYRGLDLGILKIDIPLFDEYSIFGDGICDQVSSEAERFMLGDNTPSQYSGDGVIPAANQRYFNLPGFSGDPTKLHRLRVDNRIIHTQETEQEAHISAVLAAMMGSWWTGQ